MTVVMKSCALIILLIGEGISTDARKGKEAQCADRSVNVSIHRWPQVRKKKEFILTQDLARVARIPNEQDEKSCVPWTTSLYDPSDDVSTVPRPWDLKYRQICKLFVRYKKNGGVYLCSGVLVGPYHLLTARHCVYSRCLNNAQEIRAACGYGYVEDSDKFAHYGSAFGTSTNLRYTNYDTSVNCSSSYSETRVDLDLTIVRLDRPLGEVLGYYGMMTTTAENSNPQRSSLNLLAYPGEFRLSKYIAEATEKMLYRFLNSVDVTVFGGSDYQVLRTRDELCFGGESGGPWYYDENDARYVTAVLSGGAAPCRCYGAPISNNWIQAYRALRGETTSSSFLPWKDPPDYCQIVQYQSDIFQQFAQIPLSGIGASASGTSKVYSTAASSFFAAITLYNVGTLDAIIHLDWEVDNVIIATTTSAIIPAGDVYRLTTSLPIYRYGEQSVYVHWSGDSATSSCYTDADGDFTFLGTLVATATPTPTSVPQQLTLRPIEVVPTVIPSAAANVDSTISPSNHQEPSLRPSSAPTMKKQPRTQTPNIQPTTNVVPTPLPSSEQPTYGPTTIRPIKTITPSMRPTSFDEPTLFSLSTFMPSSLSEPAPSILEVEKEEDDDEADVTLTPVFIPAEEKNNTKNESSRFIAPMISSSAEEQNDNSSFSVYDFVVLIVAVLIIILVAYLALGLTAYSCVFYYYFAFSPNKACQLVDNKNTTADEVQNDSNVVIDLEYEESDDN